MAAIYVCCDDNLSSTQRLQLEAWARNNEPLITGVYSSAVDCFAQVAKDVHDICDHDSIPVTFLTPQTKTLKEASSFLIFHLFLQNILLRLPSNNITQEEQHRLFRACLHYYRENEKYLDEIHHFQQHYQSAHAVDWYLRSRFLTRLLNKAARAQNMAILFDYRFIFRDIQQLFDESSSMPSDTQSVGIYYRAQNLNADEVDRLRRNLNGIISINRYLDLSKTAQHAVNEVSSTSNTLETVLYHFSIHQPCLKISEEKILLPVGSHFRIRHFAMESDGVWHVHLNQLSKSDLDGQINVLLNELDQVPHPYLAVGLIWDKVKQPSKADRFYRLLIQHLPSDNHETALICNAIGSNCRSKCQFTSAMNYHQQALAIYKQINDNGASFNEAIDRTFAQIALVYRDMGDLLNAVKYFKLALKDGGEEVLCHLAEIYRNLGQFQLAHQCYQQTSLQNNVGLCFIYQRLFPQAISHLQQQTESMSYINLGIYHQLRKEYDTALLYFNQALESSRDHPLDTAMIHSYLGLLNCDRRQWASSLKHYEQALDMYKRLLATNNHPTIALIHDGLGTLYLTKGEFRAAQREFERCLELQLRVLPSKHPDIAGTYNNLGGVFNEMGRYEEALLYHSEALKIATATLPVEHADIKLYEHNFAETKRKLS